MIALNLKGNISQFPGKTHFMGLIRSSLELPTHLIIFLDFLGKNIKNGPPNKLFLFSSLRYDLSPLYFVR